MTRKDKTYYIMVEGNPVRVRAAKKPNKKTIDALTAMILAVSKNLHNDT